jgi:hypothetical protein
MWDELQRRAKIEPPPSYNNGITNGPKIQSVRRTTLLDEIEWSGSENSISDREKFELLFHRFEEYVYNHSITTLADIGRQRYATLGCRRLCHSYMEP